jgi:hypothetical protein
VPGATPLLPWLITPALVIGEGVTTIGAVAVMLSEVPATATLEIEVM